MLAPAWRAGPGAPGGRAGGRAGQHGRRAGAAVMHRVRRSWYRALDWQSEGRGYPAAQTGGADGACSSSALGQQARRGACRGLGAWRQQYKARITAVDAGKPRSWAADATQSPALRMTRRRKAQRAAQRGRELHRGQILTQQRPRSGAQGARWGCVTGHRLVHARAGRSTPPITAAQKDRLPRTWSARAARPWAAAHPPRRLT